MQLQQHISNVRVEQSNVQSRVFIRGSGGYDTGLQEPVAYYIDGIALSLGANQLPHLFDLQQLQVLKGPQGSLYGRNSLAGVVKVDSLAPDWSPSMALQLQTNWLDGGDSWAPATAVSIRGSNSLVEDVVAGSLALRYEDSQGAVFNRLNSDKQSAELQSWSLSSGFDINWSADTYIRLRHREEQSDKGKGQLRYSTGPAATPRFVINQNTDGFDDKRLGIHSLSIEHQMDNVLLSAITGFSHYQRDFKADLDLTPIPVPSSLMSMDDDTWSQELRLNGELSQLKWLAGLYIYTQQTDIDFTLGGTPVLPRVQRISGIKRKGQALFSQFEWQFATDWYLTLGGRYERVQQRAEQKFNAAFAQQQYQQSVDHNLFLPAFSLSYQLAPGQQLYLSVTEGFQPGGYNYASAQGLSSFTFDKENSRNWELGYKASAMGNQLQLQFSVFDIRTQDKQIVDLLPGFVQKISNAAKTRSYGAELSVDYQFSSNWSAYMQAEAEKYVTHVFNGQGFIERNLSGKALPFAPDLNYNLGVKYSQANGLFADFTLQGASRYYFDAFNNLTQPAYQQVGLQLGYDFGGYQLSLSAQNLFDEEIISRSVTTPVGTVVEDTAPRSLGLRFNSQW